jgi:colanic acid biosynthesis glycosyl transferase WcaI
VVCHVFSGGPLFDALRKDQKWNIRRLVFHDLVPERDLCELYLCSHIQVIPEMAGLSQGAVPSKLPNLLAAGVPILYIGEKDSEVWRLIQGCRAGGCCDNWDFDDLSDLADQLLVEGGNCSHAVRQRRFANEYAALFSVEDLIKAILE